MNRQLRRAQSKQDKKNDKEKQRRRSARRGRVRSAQASRQARRQAAKEGKTESAPRRTRDPGRFSGALLIATIFFIALNAAVPRGDIATDGGFFTSPTSFNIIGALYYGLFGYFGVLWLNRRRMGRAFAVAIFAGLMLLLGGEVAKFIQGEYAPEVLFLVLVPPGLILGALLGRWVFDNAT